ncbi:lysine 2,3-aminomutase [Candidatus Syntrophocurvum alkaliphilum]|uniref:lysine 2,3-aminomutase n=1 Tax=Candidatus Syntrophocurvum alkaliphilum TaxID=2293317 RepID=UPI001FAAB65A|nr:lysine 2,3-aminomutase [Candidatus Syntrophocurvum alkaliphilum]
MEVDSLDLNHEWYDWKWQIKNNITTIEELKKFVEISKENEIKIKKAIDLFPMAITPYYASIMDRSNTKCPIRIQAIPSELELHTSDYDLEDPLHEDADSPVPGLTHRYPDRVLLLSTNECSMYCRHCTRKRKVGEEGSTISLSAIQKGIDYIKENKSIRDVVISGGDPFLLETKRLEKIISELRKIKHVEVIRIGSRTPVVLPMRIDDELVDMLKKYHPIWVNTHFNHPMEITPESKAAIRKLADAGIPLGNQSVLLKDVNDCPVIMRDLNHLLVKNRVRPYYLYQCDLSRGIEHFRTPISKGVEILESLIGHTSGFSVPTFVVDAPGGGGKIPLQPNYLLSYGSRKTILRNYEGVISVYTEPEDQTCTCPPDCNICNSKKNKKRDIIGLEKLYSDDNDTISLIPEGNTRNARRDNDETD